LKELSLCDGYWSNTNHSYLHALFDEPHQLQCLQSVNVYREDLDRESIRCLRTLSGLTELQPGGIDPACFSLLHRFSNMRRLVLPCHGQMNGAEVKGLLSSLRAMTQLSSLFLRCTENDSAEWVQLLDGLADATPQLRKLAFDQCSGLPLCAWTIAGPQLRRLLLYNCHFECTQDEEQSRDAFAQWTHSLRTLERVSICYSGTHPDWIGANLQQQSWPFAVEEEGWMQWKDDDSVVVTLLRSSSSVLANRLASPLARNGERRVERPSVAGRSEHAVAVA
jgi:hypothetical protein